jgi:hypothetical protein
VATIISPASFAQTNPVVGYEYVIAAQQIQQEITEELNVLQSGLALLVGDLAGTGADTIRVTRFGGLGFAEQMVEMADETEAVVPTGFTLNSDSVTIGRFGLAKEQTYQDQVLGRAEAIGLDDMIALAPQSWLATIRSLVAEAGATFSSGLGTSGADWTYDDELEMVAAFHETEGFNVRMKPVTIRHPEQFTDLRNSIRNEPGLQASVDFQSKILGLTDEQQGAFQFLGFRNFGSFDVPTSGGDHVGCAYVPGALAWAVASTMAITPENPAMTTWVPEFGIIIERKGTAEVATAKFVMNAWFGVAKLSSALFPQFKLSSVNN